MSHDFPLFMTRGLGYCTICWMLLGPSSSHKHLERLGEECPPEREWKSSALALGEKAIILKVMAKCGHILDSYSWMDVILGGKSGEDKVRGNEGSNLCSGASRLQAHLGTFLNSDSK
jgi:hypothetical protein